MAKNIIVVLSVVVPASNVASNVLQAATLGVGFWDMVKGSKLALVEIERYQKMQRRMAELDFKKAVNFDNEVELRKLTAEEKSINDAIDRMSIGPLIRAGEFTTIAEGEAEMSAAITEGTWVQKMKDQLDKWPEKAGTVGRYAAITRDTALFQGLARSVQYGDFIAKTVVYNHLTKRKGQDHKQAMKTVIDEFVAYNFLPSRQRSYAERMGASWFWAFKLRSIKVAHRIIRDNPLRALVMSSGAGFVPEIAGVSAGSPLTDNAASVIFDGRAGATLGWGMGIRAPGLHPILGGLYPVRVEFS